MKRLLVALTLMIGGSALGQEVLSAAGYARMATKVDVVRELPFFDDFSNYEGAPDPMRWAGDDAFVNKDYGELPPTLGVATLDAVDADGRLHKGYGTSKFSGDTLMSQIVRLDSITTGARRRLSPADSVYLSFYYLPGGGSGDMWKRNGDEPETEDSLMLELYNPATDKWDLVWATGGDCVDSLTAHTGTAWQFVTISIKNPAYFSNQFRFRFRNYCSLDDMAKTGMLGNCDHWHLDYIYMNLGRNRTDQRSFDVAFVTKAPSMLKQYLAMPARQYRPSEMKSSIQNKITNLYSTPVAVRYTYDILDENGTKLDSYDGGNDNVPCYFPNGTYHAAAAHISPAVTYQFPTSTTHREYAIRHVVRGSVTPDDHPQNDTTIFRQRMADYYAYDDGVAENGYGLTSTSSKVRLACRFVLNQPDTLTAVELCFNHTRDDENALVKFHICVWKSQNGKPGQLIYKDNQKRQVEFRGLNQYVRYVLEKELMVDDTIFVGFEQTSNEYINLGFDRGHDASRHIYYNTSGNWQQSILVGALMLRPYFGKAAMLGTDHPELPQLKIYPNPAHERVTVDYPKENYRIEMFDMMGRKVLDCENEKEIALDRFLSGMYLIRVKDLSDGRITSRKLIIR